MVRAGVVIHPAEWKICGYNEIQNPKDRYTVIDFEHLKRLLNIDTLEELQNNHKMWVESYLRNGRFHYNSQWSESIAYNSHFSVKNELLRAENTILWDLLSIE